MGGKGGLEIGPFVPPKNYTVEEKSIYFEIFKSLAFILKAQHSILSLAWPAPSQLGLFGKQESATGDRSEVLR